jgi:8-amino-7-oxononanoate synthase
MNEHDPSLALHWPLRELQQRDLYFYLQATESYPTEDSVQVAGHGRMIMLGSCSYLGLNGHPRINQAAAEALGRYGTGTHGVRLLGGTLDLHQTLEERIARFKGTQAAVTFSSGFIANVSTIAALLDKNDTVICDKLDHASIVDGCLLSRAKLVRFRHNDMEDLETCLKDEGHRARKLVVVDAVFSMDGDIVNLPEVSRLCRQYGAMLMVDEAHSLGVLGATGHGIEEHFGLPADSVDIKMGTLSKTIPSIGGYVAASASLCDMLAHQARGFIYSGALPPSAAAAAQAALDVIEDEPERVAALHRNIRHFGAALRAAGLAFRGGETAIFPIMCDDDWQSVKLARYCQMNGVYIQAIPYPVVPKGTSRLRATVTAAHDPALLDQCVEILRAGAAEVGLI